MKSQKNWAGNYTFKAASFHTPASIADVQEQVARIRTGRVGGTLHSFNDIVNNNVHILSTARLDRIVTLDQVNGTVTVEAGIRYGVLASYLHEHGFALANLASLPHISVGGAISTGTHGSGLTNGCLATSVLGMEIVTADGALLYVDRETHATLFDGMLVSLGALGVLVTVTLKVEPTFKVRQIVFEDVPCADILENWDAVMGLGYSVSLFTTWGTTTVDKVWVKQRATEPPVCRSLFRVNQAQMDVHPLKNHDAACCTKQLGEDGPWHERLPHFRLDFMPSSGDELQSEYFVPRGAAPAIYRLLQGYATRVAPILFVSEIRSIAADQLWLSPAYGEDMVAFHFTWKGNEAAVNMIIADLEVALEPFGARPHWGKLFISPPKGYPKMNDFLQLRQSFDLGKKFTNAFVERNLPQ